MNKVMSVHLRWTYFLGGCHSAALPKFFAKEEGAALEKDKTSVMNLAKLR
jgi:hypothetical protein